jgi:outer membrane protein
MQCYQIICQINVSKLKKIIMPGLWINTSPKPPKNEKTRPHPKNLYKKEYRIELMRNFRATIASKLFNFITMKRLLCFLAIAVFLANTTAPAQKSWTLEDCIRYALENNIQIKRQQLTTQIQKNTLRQSRFDMLPDLSASASHSISFQNTLNQTTYQYEKNIQQGGYSIQGSLTLFGGLRVHNSIEKNKLSLMAGLADLEKAKNDITLNIASDFLQVLFSEELLEVSKSQLDVTQMQVEKTKRFVEVGNMARGNLLEIQAQAAQEKVSVTDAGNQVQLAYLDLIQVLDLDSIGNFRVARPDSLKVPMASIILSLDTVYLDAVNRMPQIKSAEYAVKSSEKNLALAKGGLYPTLTASGGMSSRYQLHAMHTDKSSYSVFDQLNDYQGGDLALNLSIPIFSKFQNQTNVKNARIQMLDMQYGLLQQKKALYKEIQKARTDAIAALENFNSRQDAVLASEEAFKYSQQKYDVGTISSVDYNIAKNNLIKSKSDLLQAKYQFVFKVKVLDFYKGVAIVL